jgi:hypothetical protein
MTMKTLTKLMSVVALAGLMTAGAASAHADNLRVSVGNGYNRIAYSNYERGGYYHGGYRAWSRDHYYRPARWGHPVYPRWDHRNRHWDRHDHDRHW